MAAPLEPDGTGHSTPDDDTALTCSICQCNEDQTAPLIMPCGHVFHADCILTWIDTAAHVQTCPYCRSKLAYLCGHALAQELFQAGTDLRTLDTRSCAACKDFEEFDEIVPLMANIWWILQVVYTEEVLATTYLTGPHSVNPKPFFRSMKETMHHACIDLRNMLDNSAATIAEACSELERKYLDDGYDSDVYGPWEQIPYRALSQLTKMFPPQKDPSPDNPQEWEEPSLSEFQLFALSIILQQFLRRLDYEGYVYVQLYDLNLTYKLEDEIYLPRSP
ncbi:hypothetical protein F5Y06DRAFT_305638 [Hypoxylon sp. FL0890]|nr:hypothetical protein F5Y06DRAFT_305638 [Hypoxylon sp. FL0890]